MKAKDIIRDNNVDLTRSTMQKTINMLTAKCTKYQEVLSAGRSKNNKYYAFVGKLISEKRATREEIKKFIQDGRKQDELR